MPKRYRRRKGKKLTKQVYKNKKQLKLLSKAIEYKFYDTTVTEDGLDSTGASKVLNAMGQGVTINTRVANKVLARRLTIRGYIDNRNGTDTDGIARIIILKARDQNNQEQTLSLLLEDGVALNSMLKDVHKHRYQILTDKTISYDVSTHSLIPFYFTHKCKSEVQYNGNAGTYADIEDGAYYIMYFASTAAGANAPTLSFTSRFYFLDA